MMRAEELGQAFAAFGARTSRWLEELRRPVVGRTTWWAGVADEGVRDFERLLVGVLDVAADRHPEQVAAAALRVYGQKATERLSLGERVTMVQTLDGDRLLADRRLLSPTLRRQLDEISRFRNDRAHFRSSTHAIGTTVDAITKMQTVAAALASCVPEVDDLLWLNLPESTPETHRAIVVIRLKDGGWQLRLRSSDGSNVVVSERLPHWGRVVKRLVGVATAVGTDHIEGDDVTPQLLSEIDQARAQRLRESPPT